MSWDCFAFVELRHGTAWRLYQDFKKPHHEPAFNLAPASWGGRNYAHLYEQASNCDLPDDVSSGVAAIIQDQQDTWGMDTINRPCWFSLEELKTILEADKQQAQGHLDVSFLHDLVSTQSIPVRVVCWAI